jgi:hypothetical protein
MSFAHKLLVLSITAVCLVRPAFSVQVINETRPKNSFVTTNTVERGGTVDSVNTQKKSITVDGQTYSLASTPPIVHAPPGIDTKGLGAIRAGARIRFNTTKYNYAGLDQVTEVWISDYGKGTNKK